MWNKFLNQIKTLVQENRVNHKILRLSNKELEWANIYNNSTKGIQFLDTLPLNIGRWAGGYAFFYILHRILNDYKPLKILEFGLGESTKLIDAYLKNELTETTHTVLEQDSDWESAYLKRVNFSSRTQIKVLPLVKKTVKSFEVWGYQDVEIHIKDNYHLYVVDGPLGSDRFSRYDIVSLTENLTKDDDFIIIFDDFNRAGERDTFKELNLTFKERNIPVVKAVYQGNKAVAVMASLHYKYITTL